MQIGGVHNYLIKRMTNRFVLGQGHVQNYLKKKKIFGFLQGDDRFDTYNLASIFLRDVTEFIIFLFIK